MVRSFLTTVLMTASLATACPTCGCSDAKTETVADAKACSTECAEACETACETTCDGEQAAAVLAVANDSCSTECAEACDEPCESACEGEKTAAVAFASWMPAMTYKVGDESMTCSKMAGAMASEHNTHMHYVVKGVEYDDKAQAMTAHAKQLQGMMMDLVRIQYAVNGECVACPTEAHEMAASCESKTLQYRVGPAVFNSADEAIKASIMAYNAATTVKMEYAVGENTTACSVSAGEMAKAADCSVEYVVNGQRTNCKTSAGYMKTLVSVQNALKALETATKASTDA
jgi:hypothetical protein